MLDMPGENAPRILATSQVDLAGHIEKGSFRRDLYYEPAKRLAVLGDLEVRQVLLVLPAAL